MPLLRGCSGERTQGNHDPFTSVLPADAAGAAFSLQVATVQARADAATEYQIQTFPLERNGIALHLQRLAVAGTQPPAPRSCWCTA